MSIATIESILTLPDKCPIEAVQGHCSKVFPPTKVQTKWGEKTKQGLYLIDGGANKIKVNVWGHEDLGIYEGKEIQIIASGGKGLTVSNYFYQPKNGGPKVNAHEIEAGNSSRFEVVVGGPLANPEPVKAPSKPADANQASSPVQAIPAPAKAPEGLKTPIQIIPGAKIGMLLNNAILIHTSAGYPCDMKSIAKTASDIKRLSDWLEAGNLVPADDVKTPANPEADFDPAAGENPF